MAIAGCADDPPLTLLSPRRRAVYHLGRRGAQRWPYRNDCAFAVCKRKRLSELDLLRARIDAAHDGGDFQRNAAAAGCVAPKRSQRSFRRVPLTGMETVMTAAPTQG